jgi:antitoxin CptB
MKELDVLLGGFADANLETLSEHDCTALETLLEVPEGTLWAWYMGAEAPAPPVGTEKIFERIQHWSRSPSLSQQ